MSQFPPNQPPQQPYYQGQPPQQPAGQQPPPYGQPAFQPASAPKKPWYKRAWAIVGFVILADSFHPDRLVGGGSADDQTQDAAAQPSVTIAAETTARAGAGAHHRGSAERPRPSLRCPPSSKSALKEAQSCIKTMNFSQARTLRSAHVGVRREVLARGRPVRHRQRGRRLECRGAGSRDQLPEHHGHVTVCDLGSAGFRVRREIHSRASRLSRSQICRPENSAGLGDASAPEASRRITCSVADLGGKLVPRGTASDLRSMVSSCGGRRRHVRP